MMTLYHAPSTACLVVHWLLIELDVPHKLHPVDLATGQHKSPEYLTLYPAGVVPTLVIDGEPWLFTVGGRYHDRLARTAAGWRITSRVEETQWWDHPIPGLPATPYPLPDDAAR